jgi:lysophospholipase L1-like esterase
MNFSLLKYNHLFIFSFSIVCYLNLTCATHAQEPYTILHIGDSHLQPNNLSGMTRYQLQKEFGNAGRGLIFPYGLAKTNGPKDFTFTSNTAWTSSWITKPTLQAIGLTGISIQSNATSGSIQWATGKDTLAYPATFGKVLYAIQDCQNCVVEVNGVKKTYANQVKFTDTLNFSISSDTSMIAFKGCTFTLLDLMEYTNTPGIIYHSTGVAGATFKSYNDNPNVEKGLKLLLPDMVVVSLGTNESVKKWDPIAFEKEVRTFIDRIRANSSASKIVLVLPNENYIKVNGSYTYNTRIDAVHAVLLKVAKEQELLTYDQQQAMGGKGCMLQWKQQGLVNDDHIHFLRKGYQKQGVLLANNLKQYLKTTQND